MKHWKKVPGWCNFEALYEQEVLRIPNASPAIFVEIGSWFGKSTCCMGQLLKRHPDKDVQFFAVDTWQGSPAEPDLMRTVEMFGGSIYEAFLQNLRDCEVMTVVNAIKRDSVEAAALFDDDTIDFVFLDGGHTYEQVMADLHAWYPKVRKYGTIAGHDIDKSGVRRAVIDFFSALPGLLSKNFQVVPGRCWTHRKEV